MKLYKLTDKYRQTQGLTQWGENITHVAQHEGNEPCSNQVIHSYLSPELAVFLNPIHSKFSNPVMFEASGDVTGCDGLKTWGKSLATVREIGAPKISVEQKIEIAIRIALVRYSDEKFVEWANNWISGKDRSQSAAYAARAARDAAYAAYAAYAARAARAARAAADAADAAADAARDAAYAAYAARAAYAAADAAYAAADAADAAADEKQKIMNAFCVGLHLLICEVIYK
jgi:hypothetical protein